MLKTIITHKVDGKALRETWGRFFSKDKKKNYLKKEGNKNENIIYVN